ncbi:MAG TPA: ornithine carbamoyltransferase [Pseudonocardiaceae bacterium]|jgi:ornithine carbamoyltransferase
MSQKSLLEAEIEPVDLVDIQPRATDLLRLSDFSPEQVKQVLDLAAAMKLNPAGWVDRFQSRSVGCIFEKPSTRTRVSTSVAAHRLGMQCLELPSGQMQLSRGETIGDTGRVLSEYLDLIVIRTYEQHRVAALAAAASVPVINALSNDHHPLQGLADLLTLREQFGSLGGLKLAFVGDACGNICHSLLEAAALTGMTMVIATPDRYRPDPAVLATAQRIAARTGASIEIVTDPEEAVRDADAVYPEIWVPMDGEAVRKQRVAELSAYQVNAKLMALSSPGSVFMHCLPAYREQEVTSEVLDGPRSVVWQQAGNRLHTCQAVMRTLLLGDG